MERRVGFVGKENVPVGAAFGGILHLERSPGEFMSLCNRKLTMVADKDKLQADIGIVTPQPLRICKRCQALA